MLLRGRGRGKRHAGTGTGIRIRVLKAGTHRRIVSLGTPLVSLVRPLLAQSTVVPTQVQRAGQEEAA